MLDVFFLSYNEMYADDHFNLLKLFAPNAKHISGITGIFEAHQKCAIESKTSHFYVVDADAIIDEEFDFTFVPLNTKFEYESIPQTNCVYTWTSHNPINDLEYGYGAVKLFPKQQFINAPHWNIDMTTSIADAFVSKPEISNITAFNSDPFNTWKSAFRECVKLASNSINDNNVLLTSERLNTWCSKGADREFGNECLMGAQQGADFGKRYIDRPDILNKINDFVWLQEVFDSHA